MGNPIVHFEINGADEQQTAKFYSELFGWHTESMGDAMPYQMVDTHAGEGINGGFGRSEDGAPGVLFYVATDDLQATIDKAVKLGGKPGSPITEIPDVVTFASFIDPEGHEIGLVKAGDGEGPGVSAGTNPPVGWFEIGCKEPQKMWDFYKSVFDWHINGSETPEFVYGEVDTHAGGINGGIGSLPPGAPPYVSVYAKVKGVQTYLDRAEELGGKKLMGPMKVNDNLEIGMFMDGQGAMVGLYQEL